MTSELSCETSDDTSENELLERSLSVWRGWSAIELEDFTPIALDIHTACSIGHYEWVRTIIRRNEGIDLDRKNHGGWTPLMYACYIGHDNIVSLLITAGCCNMNARNPRGLTPLMLAASCGNENVARTLIRRGANVELLDNCGWTALFHATYAGHQKFVAFLIEIGANKDAIDPNTGLTPFMVAASEGHEIIVQLFLQNEVNAHAKAFNGDIARSLALLNGFMKIVSLIDNQDLPAGKLRTEADLYGGSPMERGSGPHKRHMPHSQACPLNKAGGPSIRDGPEAIARMINQSRQPDVGTVAGELGVPRGYVTFMAPQQDERKETKLSYRDVTSPINQEDYRDSSGSRDFDDLNEESNAFTKTGAITIKSSSSSSGGLMAALGLSLDSNDSQFSGSTSEKLDVNPESGGSQVLPQPTDGIKANSGTEDEPQEYDVDGDSSRPVDSHSPSLNDTSSLSSSDPRQKCNNSKHNNNNISEKTEQLDNVAGQQKQELKDYFPPLDSSFPPGVGKDVSGAADERKLSSGQKAQRHRPKVCSKSNEQLPKDNMTQTEIVSKFLNNLTLEDCNNGPDEMEDAASGLYRGHAGEEAISKPLDGEDNLDLCTCQAGDFPSEQRSASSLPGTGQTNPLGGEHQLLLKSENTQVGNPAAPMNIHTQDSTPQPQLQQQRAAHPPLNHHHPLHNRHKRHPHHHQFYGGATAAATSGGAITLLPDAHHNGMFGLIPPSTHHPHLQQNLPFLSNLPAISQQPYFYTDHLHSGAYTPHPHLHQASFGHVTLPTSLPTDPSAIVMGNPNQIYTSVADVDITKNTMHSGTSTTSGATQSLNSEATAISNNATIPSSTIPTETSGLASESNHLPHSLPVTPYGNKVPPFTIPTVANLLEQAPPPLPSLPNYHTNPVSVMIPGHSTSQPISMPPQPALTSALQQPAASEREGPEDLHEMLAQLSLLKYLDKFEEQDVDLQVFLSLTDNDLKELGIKLFGPRKKMTNAIARWHSCAPAAKNNLEQAYADKLEGEMQEMAIQLNQAYEKEEHLKAQVSQEQQLRSVTESCLMEERSGWEHACQMLHTARSKLRTLGEQQSRLRHYQKELRKQLEAICVSESSRDHQPSNADSIRDNNQQIAEAENSPSMCVDNNGSSNDSTTNSTTAQQQHSTAVLVTVVEQMKKSDKCLREMMQTLSNLVISTDHILKSTQSFSNVGKDVT